MYQVISAGFIVAALKVFAKSSKHDVVSAACMLQSVFSLFFIVIQRREELYIYRKDGEGKNDQTDGRGQKPGKISTGAGAMLPED